MSRSGGVMPDGLRPIGLSADVSESNKDAGSTDLVGPTDALANSIP
jgi:hypothetical protein